MDIIYRDLKTIELANVFNLFKYLDGGFVLESINNEKTDYVDILNAYFKYRQSQNPSYSLRAFSRDIGIHHRTVSSILKRGRPLPYEFVAGVLKGISLTDEQQSVFYKTVIADRQTKDPLNHEEFQVINPIESQKILEDENHYVFLALIQLKTFQSYLQWIANKMDLSIEKVEDIIERLIDYKLIARSEDGQLVRTSNRLVTEHHNKSDILQRSHQNILKNTIDDIPVVSHMSRHLSTQYLRLNTNQIEALRLLIEKFQDEVSEQIENEHATEVYRLNIQLMPMTEKENSK